MPIRKLLAATDFSERSGPALNRAAAVARAHDAELVVTHVFNPARYRTETPPARAAKVLDEKNRLRTLLQSTCHDLGRDVDVTPIVLEGSPGERIAEAARFFGVDAVFVGAHGCSALDGSGEYNVTESVIAESTIPTVVGRVWTDDGFRRILVAMDFSELSDWALVAALHIAKPPARIDLLHVLQVPVVDGKPVLFEEETLRSLEEKARNRGADRLARCRRPGLDLHFDFVVGTPKDAILKASAGGYDLVALGPHGAVGLERLPYGSLGQAVVRQARCSVLVA